MNSVWRFCSNGEALMEQQMVSNSFFPQLSDHCWLLYRTLSFLRVWAVSAFLGVSPGRSPPSPYLFCSCVLMPFSNMQLHMDHPRLSWNYCLIPSEINRVVLCVSLSSDVHKHLDILTFVYTWKKTLQKFAGRVGRRQFGQVLWREASKPNKFTSFNSVSFSVCLSLSMPFLAFSQSIRGMRLPSEML